MRKADVGGASRLFEAASGLRGLMNACQDLLGIDAPGDFVRRALPEHPSNFARFFREGCSREVAS